MGDRVAVLRDGVLQQFAAPRELYRNPANVFVAEFIGSPAMNLFTLPIVDSTRFRWGTGRSSCRARSPTPQVRSSSGSGPNTSSWAASVSKWRSTWSKNSGRTPTCTAESPDSGKVIDQPVVARVDGRNPPAKGQPGAPASTNPDTCISSASTATRIS